jgi:poly(A) polymerase
MKIQEALNSLIQISTKYGIDKPYLVGGVPRDLYLKMDSVKTADVDITTNSSDILRLALVFANDNDLNFQLSDKKNLTVYTDSFDLDFSSNFISDAVLKVLPHNLHEFAEAFSRDFTINTIHQDIETKEFLDPTGQAFKDIEANIIKTPVDADITLSDDPRRAWRAINLAVRYGFSIDEEIVYFIKQNKQLFEANDVVSDRFISIKITKSLKENEEHTLTLLNELGLFNSVPLAGYFKEVLIKNKLVSSYLENK